MSITRWLLAGAVVGLIVYGFACWKKQCWPSLKLALESPVWGACIAAGAHLMICAFFPSVLVHLHDATGTPIHDDSIAISLGELHGIHIFAAGGATVLLAARSLRNACRCPCEVGDD